VHIDLLLYFSEIDLKNSTDMNALCSRFL